MTFRVRHEWPDKPRRILSAELVTCPHCGTLRVSEAGKPPRYLRAVVTESERDRFDEPPCIELPPRRNGAGPKRDRIGCELGAGARERALRAAIDRGREQG